jgi:hypothetical protein
MMDYTKNDIVTTTAGSHFFLAPEAISKGRCLRRTKRHMGVWNHALLYGERAPSI